MILIKTAKGLREWLDRETRKDRKTGFVPTMGALHSGHISLIDLAKKRNDITIASIFVNPTQFNDPADFQKYPVTIEKDIAQLEAAGCDLLFLPSVAEMYPNGLKASMHYDLGYLETVLEGEYRPGHFQGVCMVVHRLLEIVMPDNLYMGQKDYQQCMVIRQLLQLTGLDQKINLVISPTLREKSGLAMSSRNMRLTKEEFETAGVISQTLFFIKDNLAEGTLTHIKEEAVNKLIAKGLRPDYVAIADAETLQLTDSWNGKQKLVALVAAYLNEVRLIDNMLLN